VLVGGSGSDRLVGSAGHDILISGELTGQHNENTASEGDYDYAVLRAISTSWAAEQPVIDSDLANPNGEEADVLDDNTDMLTGSSGHDWFIIGTGDKITDSNSATKDGDIIT